MGSLLQLIGAAMFVVGMMIGVYSQARNVPFEVCGLGLLGIVGGLLIGFVGITMNRNAKRIAQAAIEERRHQEILAATRQGASPTTSEGVSTLRPRDGLEDILGE